jgi:hypothetical protein
VCLGDGNHFRGALGINGYRLTSLSPLPDLRADDVDSPAILYLELFGNLPTITLMRSRRLRYWTRLSLGTFGVYTLHGFYTLLGFYSRIRNRLQLGTLNDIIS